MEHFGGKEAILLLQIDVISDITENMESLFLYTQLYSQECYTCLKSNVLLHFGNIYGGAKLQY